MKLLRYGEIGKEKPGILGQDGKIRDLSNHITDINGDNISEEGLNKISMINVSSLPKTSMLMIDEGFGSLDETNLESCGKLLQSLKKWFKNIIVISHIDAIKDIVDHTLDIQKKGADSYVNHN